MDIFGRQIIDSFSGDYRFLSNFYMAPVVWDGYEFASSEIAYQYSKCIDDYERHKFLSITSSRQAKRYGKQVKMRSDWDLVKFDIMLGIVTDKFSRNEDIAKQLKNTGDAVLIEGNTWHDTYWGVCNDKGENNLGKILMYIRDVVI